MENTKNRKRSTDKVTYESPCWVFPFLYPKEMKSVSYRHICTLLFIAAYYSQQSRYRNNLCPLIYEWIKRSCCVQRDALEQYSLFKKKVLLIVIWVNLKYIILSKISKTREKKLHDLICGVFKTVKYIQSKHWLWGWREVGQKHKLGVLQNDLRCTT